MSDVKWIKIVTNVFDDEKILLIESMPESDSLIVIWFKILCMAGKMNNGGVLILSDKIAYTDEMLATIFRRQLSTVKLALKVFEELEMITIINNTITIPNWSKHQSLDQLESKKKYMKEYMRKYRKEQARLASGENHIEEDLEEEKPGPKTEGIAKAKIDKKIYKDVIDYLNEKADKNYRSTSKASQRLIDARLNESFQLEDFKLVIDNKVASWKYDVNMSIYLRPNTLFGSKFESYLNENTCSNKNDYGW